MVFLTDIEDIASDLSTGGLKDISIYGGSNPDRDTIAIFAYLWKRAADMTDTALVLDNTTPLTVNSWTFALPQQDGVFVAILLGFPLYQNGTYILGNCVYYLGNYYECIAASTTALPTDATKWELLTDILSSVLNLSNSNVIITQTYNWSDAHVSSGQLADTLADLGTQIKNGKCKNWNIAAQALLGGGLVESAWTEFRRGGYVQAQEDIDFIQAQTALNL